MDARWMTAAALLALVGCDDTLFGSVEAVEGEGYDAVVEVFDTSCVSCHADATASSFGNLSLEGDPCDLVGVEASGNYTGDDGEKLALIEAGDAAASLIWNKMVGDTYGGIMPPGANADDEAQAANAEIIQNWINDDATADCATR